MWRRTISRRVIQPLYSFDHPLGLPTATLRGRNLCWVPTIRQMQRTFLFAVPRPMQTSTHRRDQTFVGDINTAPFSSVVLTNHIQLVED